MSKFETPQLVQELTGYLYQHFDSRGGSILALGFPDEESANDEYARYTYDGLMSDEHIRHLVIDDWAGLVQVRVYGQPIPSDFDGELLVGYTGGSEDRWEALYNEAERVVTLIPRPAKYAAAQHGSAWDWFSYHGMPSDEEQYSELGEDAFGLVLIRPFDCRLVEQVAIVDNLDPLYVVTMDGQSHRVDVTITKPPLTIGKTVNVVTGRSQTTVDGRYCEILSVVGGAQ